MSAEVCPASDVAAVDVVVRRTEAAHDCEVPHGMSHRLQLLNGQLELVEQLGVQQQVFRPDVLLVMRQEILEAEMLAHVGVLVLRRDLDESARIRVSVGGRLLESPLCRRR